MTEANKALAVAGSGSVVRTSEGAALDELEIDGYRVRCGFVAVDEPGFDPLDRHRDCALVEVRSFSCNYRDKALVLLATALASETRFYVVGSELAGRVLAVGAAVEHLAEGDRVMVDGFFGGQVKPWGLPTNHASRSRQVLPASKLARVPAGMKDEEAAAFSIGAQTSWAMVRRAGITKGDEVLVTAGTSNTSLFLLQAAIAAGATVSVTTRSGAARGVLERLGAAEVFVVGPSGPGFDQDPHIGARARAAGGFRAVLDPYFDLYLERSLPVVAEGGTYVSCGFERQYPRRDLVPQEAGQRPVLHDRVLARCLTRNVTIMMNCLGATSDLETALEHYRENKLCVVLDSVKADNASGAARDFLSRTFCEPDRLGKVVCEYQ